MNLPVSRACKSPCKPPHLIVGILLFSFLIPGVGLATADAPPETGNQMSVQDDVTLEVRDADLRAVFMNLAAKAGINLLLSPKIKGTLTCRVSHMPPLELIQFIARANGIDFEDHGRIKILTLEEPIERGSLTFEVISLQNASAEKVAQMIESLRLDKKTTVVHDPHGNRLIISRRE